jgi:hypothetical protein
MLVTTANDELAEPLQQQQAQQQEQQQEQTMDVDNENDEYAEHQGQMGLELLGEAAQLLPADNGMLPAQLMPEASGMATAAAAAHNALQLQQQQQQHRLQLQQQGYLDHPEADRKVLSIPAAVAAAAAGGGGSGASAAARCAPPRPRPSPAQGSFYSQREGGMYCQVRAGSALGLLP